jgi:7-carboxy-7-deazaguanine synthase
MSNSFSTLSLNLVEIFASIQGESSFTGLPTTFIRLAACNLRCSWCDTPYSFDKGIPWSLEKIIEKTHELGCPFVCITGGEPLLQKNIYTLMTALCDSEFTLTLETGGSLPIHQVDPRVTVILDIKCPGSNMNNKNDWSNLALLRRHDEVKFVLANEEDYLYAKNICDQYQLFSQVNTVLFSPVHQILHPEKLVGWILRDHLRVRLNLQLHKYIWEPSTRGV